MTFNGTWIGHRIDLDLTIPADWDRIDLVREAVGLCLAAAFGRGELEESMAMVSAELLENAVKYARPGQHGIRFGLRQKEEFLVVAVTNLVDDLTPVKLLQERLDWLRQYPDPGEAYLAALTRIYEQPPSAEASGSGLGLVRIAYEGGCRVDCDTSAPGKLTVTATRPLTESNEA